MIFALNIGIYVHSMVGRIQCRVPDWIPIFVWNAVGSWETPEMVQVRAKINAGREDEERREKAMNALQDR